MFYFFFSVLTNGFGKSQFYWNGTKVRRYSICSSERQTRTRKKRSSWQTVSWVSCKRPISDDSLEADIGDHFYCLLTDFERIPINNKANVKTSLIKVTVNVYLEYSLWRNYLSCNCSKCIFSSPYSQSITSHNKTEVKMCIILPQTFLLKH